MKLYIFSFYLCKLRDSVHIWMVSNGAKTKMKSKVANGGTGGAKAKVKKKLKYRMAKAVCGMGYVVYINKYIA